MLKDVAASPLIYSSEESSLSTTWALAQPVADVCECKPQSSTVKVEPWGNCLGLQIIVTILHSAKPCQEKNSEHSSTYCVG